jgi:hypothetical protein
MEPRNTRNTRNKNQIFLNYHPASQSLGTPPKQGGELFFARETTPKKDLAREYR